MWILDALDEIPLKKPLLVWAGILAAAFLLLAQIPGQIPLIHPVTFTLVSLTLYLLNQKKSSLRRALLFVPAAGVLTYLLVPQYLILFTGFFCLIAGTFSIPKCLRIMVALGNKLRFAVFQRPSHGSMAELCFC